MRARTPDFEGMVETHGAKVAYEVYGTSGPTVVFPPISTFVTSRAWKGQIPFLARHRRLVVIDAIGNGRSERSLVQEAYTDQARVDTTFAVMDEVGVEAAALVGICSSTWVALLCAAQRPERVLGVAAISPMAPYFQQGPDDAPGYTETSYPRTPEGLSDYFEFFFNEMLPEPHSSKPREDAVGWGLEATPEIVALYETAPSVVHSRADTQAMLEKVSCPVLVVAGENDRCQTIERTRTVTEVLDAESVEIIGAGHLVQAREPVAVNLAVASFLDRVLPVPRPARTVVRPIVAGPRVLYLSSPIGLGHARRDVSIARALCDARPEVHVDWLAQPPLTQWLEERGETIHPASHLLASETAHIDAECGEHALNAFQAIRRMDEILLANFMLFNEIVEKERYDLWIGDEAWDLDYFLHENPELKRAPYVWLTDFVGWLPMPEGGEHEAELTADYNADMLEQIARLPWLRDRSIFVGSPDDIVPDAFGPGLPGIRDWTTDHFEFSGYVADTPSAVDRAQFGFGPEPVCVVAVGGSGVGGSLLRRAVEAHEELATRVPGLRTVLVTGPRIDPASILAPSGVEVRGYVPDLDRMLAACDVALVQGGLGTTMELAAAGTPFVYVPLRGHFEQNRHVRHRLERYRAGRCVTWDEATPGRLADELSAAMRSKRRARPVETDGAHRAAAMLADLF
jgi:pimeloyl-ACP methyl ester carboxylesterase/predicted glycosyltransferase